MKKDAQTDTSNVDSVEATRFLLYFRQGTELIADLCEQSGSVFLERNSGELVPKRSVVRLVRSNIIKPYTFIICR